MRSVGILLLFLAASLGWACGSAVADDVASVPIVRDADLPVVGTAAPIRTANLTHVLVGKVLGRYRVDGRREVLDDAALLRLFQSRAGQARPSEHAVWITADKNYAWAKIYGVLEIAAKAGLYRVGVRVLHEQGGAYGFPLFLPLPTRPTGVGAMQASRMPLRIEELIQPEFAARHVGSAEGDLGDQPGVGRGGLPGFRGIEERLDQVPDSNPKWLFQIARTAVGKFGDLVAEIAIDHQCSLQYALTTMDMLYRAGCVGVRIRSGQLFIKDKQGNEILNLTPGDTYTKVSIARRPRAPDFPIPPRELEELEIPRIAPRRQPWPLEGANHAGGLYADLLELPVDGEAAPTRFNDPRKPWPNSLKETDIPAHRVGESAAWIRKWSQELAPQMLAALRGGTKVSPFIVVRKRGPQALTELLAPAQRIFADATEVRLATLRVDVYLVNGIVPVGKAEATLNLIGDQLNLVSAVWTNENLPPSATLPPEPVDDFASGLPGAVRFWLENAFGSARRLGAAALPLAPTDTVLRGLPAAYHAQARPGLDARGRSTQALATAIQSRSFDRLLLVARDGSAAVLRGPEVVGVLIFGFESEEQELRVHSLTPRR